MPKFCHLKKQVQCLGNQYKDWFDINSVDVLVKRFNVGGIVELDMYGEPINSDETIATFEIKAKFDKQVVQNSMTSNIGGITDVNKEFIVLQIKLNEDVQENDLLEYPIGSNDWYKVEQFLFKTQRTKYLKAYAEIRSSE